MLGSAEKVPVRMATLSGVLREHLPPGTPVLLLKVDVERAEAEVLAGLMQDDWPRVQQVCERERSTVWCVRATGCGMRMWGRACGRGTALATAAAAMRHIRF